jgi:hypothetical protein
VHPFIAFWMLPIDELVVRDSSPETDSTMGALRKVADNTFGSVEVANTGFSTKAGESHDSISNVKTAERDGPLEGANKRLELGSLVRRAERGLIQFRMITLGERSEHFLGRVLPSKEVLVVVNHTLDICSSRVTKGTIRVPEEVTTQVVTRRTNPFQFVVPGVSLECIHELGSILEGYQEIVNIDTDIFVAVTSIAVPDIGISKGRGKTHSPESISKLFMESCTRRAEAVEGLADSKGVTLERAKFRSSLEDNSLLGISFKVSIPNISRREFKAIELSQESNNADATKRGNRGVDRVLGRSSEVTTSHKSSLTAAILLAVKDKVTVDIGIARRGFGTLTKILKGIVIIELANFSGNGISPESIAILFVKFIGFLGSPWDLDAKLVANSRSFGATAGLVEHPLEDFGTACEPLASLPSRRIE